MSDGPHDYLTDPVAFRREHGRTEGMNGKPIGTDYKEYEAMGTRAPTESEWKRMLTEDHLSARHNSTSDSGFMQGMIFGATFVNSLLLMVLVLR